MSDSFSDMTEAQAQAAAPRGRLNIQVETIDDSGHTAPVVGGNDEIVEGSFGGRTLKPSTLKLLEQLAPAQGGTGADGDEAEPEAKTDDEADRLDAAADGKPATEAKPEGEAKPDEAKAEPVNEYKTQAERLEAANRNLIAELETERTKPRVTSTHNKLVEDARSEYLDDQTASIRKFIAAALHHEDPNHADVTAEMALLYGDLTSKELGVSLTESQQASRDAARARQLLARDKRERKADSEAAASKVSADAEAKKADSAATFIHNRISSKSADYPLLHALAQDIDGLSPGHLLWKVMERESNSGVIDAKTMSDDQMIEAAAKLVEKHYQELAEKIGKAKPQPKESQPSTAEAPKTDAQTSTSKDQRQSHGARTLNKADASVAPATPPAKKAEATKSDAKPKFKSDKERREWALRHLPK